MSMQLWVNVSRCLKTGLSVCSWAIILCISKRTDITCNYNENFHANECDIHMYTMKGFRMWNNYLFSYVTVLLEDKETVLLERL